MVCPRCGLFVDWRSCKRAAYQRKPEELRDGDGCRGMRCGTRSTTARERARAQRKFRRALEDGARRLVAWPDKATGTDAWQRPDSVRDALIARSRDMYPSDEENGDEGDEE